MPADIVSVLSVAASEARQGLLDVRTFDRALETSRAVETLRTGERAAGDTEVASSLERQNGEVADAMRRADRVIESADLSAAAASAEGLNTLVLRLTTPGARPLRRVFDLLSEEDQIRMATRAATLMAKGSTVEGVLRNMTGFTRELVAFELPEVFDLIAADYESYVAAEKAGVRQYVDTAVLGDVYAPTALQKGARNLRLGPDRITATAEYKDGLHLPGHPDIPVAGDLELRIIIEVKPASTAEGGARQMVNLEQRLAPGYLIFDNQLWRVRYDRSAVKHVLVAPPGNLPAARKILDRVPNPLLIQIPRRVDEATIGMSRLALKIAKKLRKLR